jgi:hypothetical protein
MTIINKQLGIAVFWIILSEAHFPLVPVDGQMLTVTVGWNPKTPLKDLLETTLTYQHKTYKEAVKRQMSQASASS